MAWLPVAGTFSESTDVRRRNLRRNNRILPSPQIHEPLFSGKTFAY